MQTHNELDIRKYIDIFQKYKWHALIPAVVVMVVLFVGSLFLPKVYESTCAVEVDQGSIENPLKRNLERRTDLNEHLSVFSENALRWNILSQVADKVGHEEILRNSDIYSIGKVKERFGLVKPVSSQSEQTVKEHVVAILRKGIEFRQKPPKFLVISYRGTRSEVNAKILNTLVSALIEEKTRAALNAAGQNLDFVKAELENYRRKLEEAEAELKEFKEQHIAELPTNMNVNLTQLTNDKSELLASELEMKELASRLQYLDDELQKQKELIVSEVKREANPMLTVLNQRIVEMEIELTRLRTNYTDLHPRVVELTGQLDDLKRQRDAAEQETLETETSQLNPIYQQLTQDRQNTLVRMEVLKNRIASLEKRIEQNEEKVRGMPEQEQQLATLTRNYEVTSNIYNMFLQKLEEVRLQEKLANEEKSTESFKVLEYARATFTPVAPEPFKVTMIIVLTAAGVCFGIMALLNHFDDSFKTVEEAKEFIGKPLLGTVPSLDGSGNGDIRILGMLGKGAGTK
ncbi:MAG: hypothetical protein Kow0099_26840 [Candidatus Abyssubacteria bacterium]